jgi:hypothetical protein
MDLVATSTHDSWLHFTVHCHTVYYSLHWITHSKYHCNYSTHKVYSSQPDFQLSTLATDWMPQTVQVIISRHGPHRKRRSSVACSIVAVQFSLIKNLLPSNGHCSVVCFAAVAKKRMLFQSLSLATAFSLAPQSLLSENMTQYFQ